MTSTSSTVAESTEMTESSNNGSTAPGRDDGLPGNFDLLIVGTGLVESIVSAAVSRNGHTVLQIDPRDYYGGTWGTFGLDQWMSANFMEIPSKVSTRPEVKLQGNNEIGKIKWKKQVECFQQVWYDETVKEELVKQRMNRFNIDLMPKLIAAREDIIQLLITSNVSRYLEFLRVARLLTNLPPPNVTDIEPIPLSRSDIFTSKSLTLVEKRNLVKLIETVLKSKPSIEQTAEELEPKSEALDTSPVPETFDEIIQISKASDKLRHMVKSSVTILDDGFSSGEERFNQEFCKRCRLFLGSIGRYGNQTPYLWTLYGISEICQAFCRLSAVYGGIFILNRYLTAIQTIEDGFQVKTSQDEFKVKNVVLGPSMVCDIVGKDKSKKMQSSIIVGRAVLITKGGNIKTPEESVKSKGDGIYLYRLSGLEVIELNYTSQAVPKHPDDFRLLQISFPVAEESFDESRCRKHVEEVLSQFVEFPIKNSNPATHSSSDAPVEDDQNSNVLPKPKPVVIYGSYFTLSFKNENLSSDSKMSGSKSESRLIETGIASTDLTAYVLKAQEIFNSLYPDEEFLPKAPDCEDENAEDAVNGEEETNIPSAGNDSFNQNSNENDSDTGSDLNNVTGTPSQPENTNSST